MRSLVRVVFPLVLALSACSTYREHLNRGERMYDENEYEKALAVFRSIENDTDSLTYNEQAKYAYLRGMTDYRLGFRPDARHWLAIAKAIEMEHSGGLTAEHKSRVEEALNDLNKEVYGGAESTPESESTAVEHDRGAVPEEKSAPAQ